MQVGVFDHLDNATLPMAQFLEQRLTLIEAYERAGFYAYHLAEHHGTALGMAPSPNVFLAAVAMRTRRLRFGPMVYALPLYHPLRLAQEICMLDQLSGGRLIMGFGRGSSPAELRFYDVDPAEAEAIFRRSLPLVLEALETGVYRDPARAAPLDEIEMKVSCLQKPSPPVWYGVHSPESAERAAMRGWQTISLDAADEARACSRAYRRAMGDEAGDRLLGLGRFVVVAETDAQAEALAARAYAPWHKAFTHLARKLGSTARHPRPDTWAALHRQGKGVAGSPDTVARFLRAQMEEAECNYLVGQFAFGDLAASELATSLELFRREVMPQLGATACELLDVVVIFAEEGRMRGVKVWTRACVAALCLAYAPLACRAAEVQFGTTGKSDATSIVSYIGMERKLFQANGLTLNWIAAGSAARAVQQTLAGSLDIAIAATDQTVRAIAQGGAISIVAGAVGAAPFRVLGQKGVNAWPDLKGKVVSVGGPSDQTLFFFHIMARKNGLKDSDYDLVFGGTTPARFSQLASGAVGAAVLTNPNDLMALDAGYTDLGAAPDYVPVWAQNNVFVHRDWAKKNPASVVAFLKAFLQATDIFYDKANREEVLATLMKYTSSDRSVAERVYDFYQQKKIIMPGAELSEAGIQAVVDSLVEIKELAAPIPVSSLIDASYLAAAKK